MKRFDVREGLKHPTNQTDFKPTRAGLEPAPTMFLFAVLVLTCFAGDVGAGSKPALTNIRPIIRFDQEKVDLGKIVQGDIAEHVFLVYNDGAAPLKILKLKPA